MINTIPISVVFNRDGKSIRCIYLNNYRICGAKPYVSENLQQFDFTIDAADLAAAGFGPSRPRRPRKRAPAPGDKPE